MKTNRGTRVDNKCRTTKGKISPGATIMQLPPLSAQSVAQALEWSGFGPAVATTETELVVRVPKKGSPQGHLDFTLELLPDGSLRGFEPTWGYQNKLHPMVRAVLTVISEVFMNFGDREFFEAQIEEDFDSKLFLAQSTYLWMLPHPDPDVRIRLVLNEFLVRGVPVWVQLDQHDYDEVLYCEFFKHTGAMVKDFRDKGKLPRGIRLEQLNDCINHCIPDSV